MPEYLHPGVYIEEQPAPQTIEGVSTSTAGFVGVTAKGPTAGLPQLVTSFADFNRIYGGYLSEEAWGVSRFLAYAIEGFFNNGGQRAYVKRVVGPNAAKASLTLNDGFVTRLLEDTASERAGRVTLRLATLRGIAVGTDLTFEETIAGTDQSQTQQVTAYDSSTNSVTVDAPLDLRYTKAGCKVFVSGVADAPRPENGAPGLKVTASSEGIWGRRLQVSANDMNGAVGLAEAAGVATTMLAANLAFAANGPANGAINVDMNAASFAALMNADVVEFANTGGDRERRTITKGGNINWIADPGGGVTHDYSGGGSTIARVTTLAFTANGPANGATSVDVNAASFAALVNGDVVEFANTGGDPERRTIAKGAGTTIDWSADPSGGVTHDYSGAGSTIVRVTALAFAANGPANGATSVDVNPASLAALVNGDVVEFANTGGDRERRTITTGASTIQWTGTGNGALSHDYSTAGATVVRITALRSGATNPVVPVTDTTGFVNGDLTRVSDSANSLVVKIATVDSATQVTLDTTSNPITQTFEAGDDFVLATAGRTGSLQLDLRSTNNFYQHGVVEIDDGRSKSYHQVDSINGHSLVFTSALSQDVPSGTAVRVVEFSLSLTDGSTSERFDHLSLNPSANNYVVNIVNLQSRLVQVSDEGRRDPIPFNLPRTTDGTAQKLVGGNDGSIPNANVYRGVDNGPGNRTGIKALADIDAISIIAAPGISDSAVQAELIGQCEELKDRFAVLDPARGSVMGSGRADDVIVQRNNHDTLYAAMYYPWLRILDPLYRDDRNGRLVPPSGHAIGIYARVDNGRGVHKAPANEVVRGILDVEVKLNDREQDILNPLNINVIRDFRDDGRGIRVWGARCVTSDNAWKYIPVRRLFIFIEESLDEGLQWVVFEPNGENLWGKVRRTISGFLRTLWLNGQLAGVTQDEAFFVRCDRTTMTEDDIANGRLICLVGVAPLRPAEFVIIRIGQKTLEAQE